MWWSTVFSERTSRRAISALLSPSRAAPGSAVRARSARPDWRWWSRAGRGRRRARRRRAGARGSVCARRAGAQRLEDAPMPRAWRTRRLPARRAHARTDIPGVARSSAASRQSPADLQRVRRFGAVRPGLREAQAQAPVAQFAERAPVLALLGHGVGLQHERVDWRASRCAARLPRRAPRRPVPGAAARRTAARARRLLPAVRAHPDRRGAGAARASTASAQMRVTGATAVAVHQAGRQCRRRRPSCPLEIEPRLPDAGRSSTTSRGRARQK